MRVTYRSINRSVQETMIKRYGDLSKLQEQLSTGKRLLKPSDNPIDVANDLKLKSKIKQLEQFNKNTNDGKGFMEVTDTAITSMDGLMQRIREQTISASSDTKSAKERLYIGSEVQQLLRQMIALLNSSFKGDYVFAGTQTKIAPFPIGESKATDLADYADLKMAYFNGMSVASTPILDTPLQLYNAFSHDAITRIIPGSFKLSVNNTTYTEGTDFTVDYKNGTITILSSSAAASSLAVDVLNGIDPVSSLPYYRQGGFKITFEHIDKGKDIYGDPVDNNDIIYRQIETGITSPINITADELLLDKSSNTNLLDTLITLNQELNNNNGLGIRNSIQKIDISLKTMLTAQATNGARINRFETTSTRNESQTTEAIRLQSELEDAELAQTSTDFALAQTVYEAALRSAAKIIQPSLVNFL